MEEKTHLLFKAVQEYESRQVEELLDQGADVNARDDDGNTCVHWAIMMNYPDILDLLLSRGANPNIINKEGEAPLTMAIQKKHSEKLVRHLINGGAYIETHNKYRKTPLHLAVQSNCESIVDQLLEANVNVNSADLSSNTPLHVAVLENSNKIVKKLLVKGANIEIANLDRQTPLHFAVLLNCESILDMLLEANADVNVVDISTKTPLHIALLGNNIEIVKTLLAKGANIKITNEDDTEDIESLLYSAVKFRCESIVDQLLEFDVDVNVEYSGNHNTLLHMAVFVGNNEIVQKLLSKGANIEAIDSDGATPLFSALRGNNLSGFEILLQNGAKLNKQNKHRRSLLCLAFRSRKAKFVQLLINAGANMSSICNDGGDYLEDYIFFLPVSTCPTVFNDDLAIKKMLLQSY